MGSPTLSTTYGPDSVTTATPNPMGMGATAPNMDFFAEMMRRRLAAKEAKEAEDRRMRIQLHGRQIRGIDEDRLAQRSAKTIARRQANRPGEVIPDKWITELVPTGYGHQTVRTINPMYEKWAAGKGQFDVGPEGVSLLQSIAPAASMQGEADTGGGAPPPPGEDERADFFGTGTTNRKAQALTLRENAQKREADSDVDEYLKMFGGR